LAVATLPTALALLALLHATSAAQAKSLHPDYQLMHGDVQQYGDWLVGCDNRGACEMAGFPEMLDAIDGDGPAITDMGIRIAVSGDAEARPAVEFFPIDLPTRRSAMPADIALPFKLFASGKPFPRHFGYSRTTLMPEDAGWILTALTEGKTLVGVRAETGHVLTRFPQDQFNRAYQAMEARRAFLLKTISDAKIDNLPGELPDGSSMPVPGKLRRIPATEMIVSGFVPVFVGQACGAAMANFRGFRFANGAMLWSYSCAGGASVPRSFWEMAHADNGKVTPLDLPEPREGRVRAGVDGLESVTFDWDFGILRSFRFQNGREDCGSFHAWGYTDSGWHLIERREMPLCKGLLPNEWIRTHSTPTDGAGPDE
jgi:hypothetical protein